MTPRLAVTAVALAIAWPVHAQTVDELRSRRDAVLARLPHEVLVVPARATPAGVDAQGFRQEASFLYLTGLDDALGAVLVLDGTARAALLFQPKAYGGFAQTVGLAPAPPASITERSGIASVEDADRFIPYLRERIAAGAGLRLALARLDDALATRVATPPVLAGPRAQWKQALAGALGGAAIADDTFLAELRLVKSPAEIAHLRRAGAASAAAFLAGLKAVGPGRRQRAVEAAVTATCLKDGDGVSFFPWAMSGASGVYPAPWGALRDPAHLDRAMQAGELVRLDVGCMAGGYMGDVGRTLPASRRFTAGQREAWDLLVAAYRAGLRSIRDGVTIASVIETSRREAARRQPTLRSDLARRLAAAIAAPDGAPFWQVHGVGLDVAEGPGGPAEVLRAGMVVDYEPIVSVDGHGFYLEDMLLVTATGHEILTPGLPYLASEIEAAMRVQKY